MQPVAFNTHNGHAKRLIIMLKGYLESFSQFYKQIDMASLEKTS